MTKQLGKISLMQIVEAFPEKEYERLLNRNIKRIEDSIPDFTENIETIDREYVNDEFTRWFFKQIADFYIDKQIKESYKRLTSLKKIYNLKNKNHIQYDVESIKKIPIEAIYEFQKIYSFGKKKKAICPFHDEDTPSFIIYPENTFYCFGCHKGGDVIKFIQYKYGLSFFDAIKFINDYR